MKHFGSNQEIAPLVQIPAKTALEYQSRQTFVNMAFEPTVANQLLDYIGRFDPTYVENYKKKLNSSMTSGNIVLMVLGAICLYFGLTSEGTLKWFCLPMAIFCLGWALFRIVIQILNNKLNG